jgi:hypothetical protein
MHPDVEAIPQAGSRPVRGTGVRSPLLIFSSMRFIFPFSKTLQFPNKSAFLRPAAFFLTPIIPNLYRAIMIFTGFFGSDPLPTREK